MSFKSESTKLEIPSVGPLLPETIGLPTCIFLCILVSVYKSGMCVVFFFTLVKSFVGHFVDMS